MLALMIQEDIPMVNIVAANVIELLDKLAVLEVECLIARFMSQAKPP